MKKIIGVGLAGVDQIISWKDVAIPVRDNKVVQYDIQGGGMTATALVAAARLGSKTEFWGVVGDDPLGRLIVDDLEREGVDTSQVARVKGGQGPVYLVCVDAPTGERFLFTGIGLKEPRTPFGDIGRLKQAGCLLIDGARMKSAGRAVRTAAKLGIPVVFDTGFFEGVNADLMPFIDYVIAPETCTARLGAGNDHRQACRTIKAAGAGTVVITLGNKGLIAYDGTSFIEQKAFTVPVVDTTGAGDTFHGAFCHGILAGLPLKDNLTFSSAVAALKCRKLGGRLGIPSLAEVKTFLRRNGCGLKGL